MRTGRTFRDGDEILTTPFELGDAFCKWLNENHVEGVCLAFVCSVDGTEISCIIGSPDPESPVLDIMLTRLAYNVEKRRNSDCVKHEAFTVGGENGPDIH